MNPLCAAGGMVINNDDNREVVNLDSQMQKGLFPVQLLRIVCAQNVNYVSTYKRMETSTRKSFKQKQWD